MMKFTAALTTALTVAFTAALCLSSSVFAHDDDGKIRDRQKAVRGPVWHEGAKSNKNDGGVAGTFVSSGIQLKSWLPLNTLSAASTSGNSCWGYISPAGREYAIMGTSDGTAFVEITNPSAATLKAFMTGPTSLWRDVRVYQQYCYAASEAGSGIQVFNISQLDTTGAVTLVNTILAPTTTTAASHTLAIDTVSGYLYRAGGGSNGLRIYDIHTNPALPTYVGAWSPIYIHEAQVVTYTSGPNAGKQIAFCCGGSNGGNVNTGLYVVDVTDKANPIQLSYTTYPGARYCHQGWLDENSQFFYINDELDEGDTVSVCTTLVMNVLNLSNVIYAGKFDNGNSAIGHNCFVRGTKLYEANYRSGVRIFDLAVSTTNPPEVAYFDTYPGSDAANFNGLWNVWPFFPSGTLIGSDLERGLFVWKVESAVATFAVANPPLTVSPAGGTPVDVTITPGAGVTLNPASAKMLLTVNGSTVERPLTLVSGTTWRATFSSSPCTQVVSYQFEIASTDGTVTTDTVTRTALSAISESVISDANFELAGGWVGSVAGDTAVSGQWVRVDPVGTTAQPENDHSAVGALCWVTGNGVVGGGAGVADVDGGYTTLLSPNFDLSGLDEPLLEYWYWYSNSLGGAPNLDSMPVDISNNGGTTWVAVETIASNFGVWTKRSWRVRDFITPTATVRLRFIARDLDTGSLVEAGVDDVRFTNIDCAASIVGDLNGDGDVNGADLSILLSAWGQTGSIADLDGDGIVGAADLAVLINAWTS